MIIFGGDTVIFGRFTERAQVVLVEAQQESQSFKHGYIGTEHVLLGILKENGYHQYEISNYALNGMECEHNR